jgi:hypothetical protein
VTERRTSCRFCPRRLTSQESQLRGFGEKCGRDRGLIPPKQRRRTRAPQSRPAPVPPAPDTIPGQTALELFYFAPTLESL